MAPANRPEGSLNLNLSGLSPIGEPSLSSTSAKSPFTGPKSSATALGQLSRVGAGSPLHESAQRLFPKRTRELQTPTGTVGNIWGPPTSGTSTPLFEIPESPNQDGFPDLVPLTETGINSPARRGRAGTLPSRISPTVTSVTPAASILTSKTSRPTPSTSPFRPGSASEKAFNSATQPAGASALARLRAGSMPQRANIFGGSSFMNSQSPFVSSWNSRTRAATLTSISSADDPSSPPPTTGFGKEDPGVRTLDYLGLAETPASENARLADQDFQASSAAFLTSLSNKNSNRFRSFSVNTNNLQYGAPQQDSLQGLPGTASGTMTPSAAAALEAEYEAIQERVRMHNKAVQDFALNASAARPRARTAGLVDAPHRSALRRYGQHLLKDSDAEAIHAAMASGEATENELAAALYNMNVQDPAYTAQLHDQSQGTYDFVDESHSQASRSLWIGSIPNSTTTSTLDTIFSKYGSIESTRVLTHKNCGFVNYVSMQDAMHARQLLNNTEIFPGSGPVRIGFAKAPSNNPSPPIGGLSQSPLQPAEFDGEAVAISGHASNGVRSPVGPGNSLADMQTEILDIVMQLGADANDLSNIQASINSSLSYTALQKEVPPLADPTTNRVFDAPRLRDIRKRIDNGQCAIEEIEQTAIEMLPEIAELSADYLGNTVVQKLFEFCSENIKEEMLAQIAPHMAEIGIHKNGTWAAQKIIETCRTDSEIRAIVDHLRPYTVPLFLDQFGNYVLQCCLRFGPQYNGFLFETMLTQLWEMAQGRFGARAMRACLESHNSTKDQQRMMAAVIALNSVQLATNTNGALLLTWFLDTCTFPRRRSVLAPRLIPHLVQLCSHKVAYLTVLKVINQRNEPEARESILQALFFSPNDSTLEQVLRDQSSGVTCIFKILTSPFLDESMRSDVVRNITNVLNRLKALPGQGYKRLMDEVGMTPRGPAPGTGFVTGGPGSDRPRGMPQGNGGFVNTFVPGMNGMDAQLTPQRSSSADAFGYSGYGSNGSQSFTPMQQHYGGLAQQQGYQGYNMSGARNQGGHLPNGYAGYNTPPSVDYRGISNQSASPVPFNSQMSPMMGNAGFAQPYAPSSSQGNMYGYNGNGNGGNMSMQPQQNYNNYGSHMQGVHAGGRGRRQQR